MLRMGVYTATSLYLATLFWRSKRKWLAAGQPPAALVLMLGTLTLRQGSPEFIEGLSANGAGWLLLQPSNICTQLRQFGLNMFIAAIQMVDAINHRFALRHQPGDHQTC